jgi:Fur family ferric uptake transcriptional regulator
MGVGFVIVPVSGTILRARMAELRRVLGVSGVGFPGREMPLPLDAGPGAAVHPGPTTGEHPMPDTILERCEAKGLRMTGQRRTIAQVLEASEDHPDVEELYARAQAMDAAISLATVYRTVKLFEEAGILDKLEFGDGRARYEDAEREHHDHLIDMTTGAVIEFVDPEIEALQERIAERLGYRLKGHKLELYGVPIHRSRPPRG